MSNKRNNTEEYNGWSNWQTWNVALWISNDEGLYAIARKSGNYATLSEALVEEFDNHYTPDGVAWRDSALDTEELDRMIEEL